MSGTRYTIRDGANNVAQAFACFETAQSAAVEWCREKGARVPIYIGRKHLADAVPTGAGRATVDLTAEGCLHA